MKCDRTASLLRKTERHIGLALTCLLFVPGYDAPAAAQDGTPPARDPMVLVDNGALQARARLEVINALFGSAGTWFGLASLVPSASFSERRSWGESWIEPGIDARLRLGSVLELYGGFSAGASRTWRADAFDQRNEGEISVENAFGGLRTRNPASSSPQVAPNDARRYRWPTRWMSHGASALGR